MGAEGIEFLFPGQKMVFAAWYTGTVRIPMGKTLKHVHGGYLSRFEKDLFLEFKNGVFVEEKEVDNREVFEREKRETKLKELRDAEGKSWERWVEKILKNTEINN